LVGRPFGRDLCVEVLDGDQMERTKLMRRRNVVVATLLGASGVLAMSGSAAASETWCDVDPPVLIRTPEGGLRMVYVVCSGPALLLPNLVVPAIEYEVRPGDGGDSTRVVMSVTVRDTLGLLGGQAVRSEVWTGPVRMGELLSSEAGTSGSAMLHRFKLDVA
jgi:hypothetical protein